MFVFVQRDHSKTHCVQLHFPFVFGDPFSSPLPASTIFNSIASFGVLFIPFMCEWHKLFINMRYSRAAIHPKWIQRRKKRGTTTLNRASKAEQNKSHKNWFTLFKFYQILFLYRYKCFLPVSIILGLYHVFIFCLCLLSLRIEINKWITTIQMTWQLESAVYSLLFSIRLFVRSFVCVWMFDKGISTCNVRCKHRFFFRCNNLIERHLQTNKLNEGKMYTFVRHTLNAPNDKNSFCNAKTVMCTDSSKLGIVQADTI